MTDDLAEAIRSTEGEGPSPVFVANLRELILDETLTKIGATGDVAPDIGLSEKPSKSGQQRNPRGWGWMSISVAAAALVLLAGFALSVRGAGQERVETVPPVSAAEPGENDDLPTVIPTEPPVSAQTAVRSVTPISGADSFLEEGSYSLDVLGTGLAFSADFPLWVDVGVVGGGTVSLTDPTAPNRHDRALSMMRVTALSNPADPTVPFGSLGDGWSPRDFDGWLDALPEAVVLGNRQQTRIGGFDALRVDLDASAMRCGTGDFCSYFATNNLVQVQGLGAASTYRIWLVDQGAEAPIALIASRRANSESVWFESVDRLIATLAFGEVAPNPLRVLPMGQSTLPVLGGSSFTLDQRTPFYRDTRGFDRLAIDPDAAVVDFLVNPFDRSGSALTSSDELAAALAQLGAELDEGSQVFVDRFTARVFDYSNEWFGTELQTSAEGKVGWNMPYRGRIWIIEHPDRGLLMIHAGVTRAAEDQLPDVLTTAATLIESLEFIDSD